MQLVVARHYTYSLVKDLVVPVSAAMLRIERQEARLSRSGKALLSIFRLALLRMKSPPGRLHPSVFPLTLPGSVPRARVVGLGRLELPTSPLSGVRSNHLSYRPMAWDRLRWAGGAGRDRTGDLLNANQALSQLSYSPLAFPGAEKIISRPVGRPAASDQPKRTHEGESVRVLF